MVSFTPCLGGSTPISFPYALFLHLILIFGPLSAEQRRKCLAHVFCYSMFLHGIYLLRLRHGNTINIFTGVYTNGYFANCFIKLYCHLVICDIMALPLDYLHIIFLYMWYIYIQCYLYICIVYLYLDCM